MRTETFRGAKVLCQACSCFQSLVDDRLGLAFSAMCNGYTFHVRLVYAGSIALWQQQRNENERYLDLCEVTIDSLHYFAAECVPHQLEMNA